MKNNLVMSFFHQNKKETYKEDIDISGWDKIPEDR